MKISYKILWIDDELSSIEVDLQDIIDFLEEFGIHADISVITASSDQSTLDRIKNLALVMPASNDQLIHDLVKAPIKDTELDILLVDYHMDDMKGDELIKRIRETDHVYLPVVFYSSRGVDDMLDAARVAQLDGIYIAARDQLIQKFKDVARSLLNKEHTTKRTRGLLMEGVSEIDAKFEDVYKQAWKKLTEDDRQKLIEHLKEKIIVDRVKDAEKKLEKFPADPEEFSRHMDEKFLSKSYDTYTRWRVVRRMLDYLSYDSGSREILKGFGSQEEGSLLKLRNIYAHNTRQKLEENHSIEKCVKIRRELRCQQDNIDRIVDSG